MATTDSLIDADLAPTDRREKLKAVAKAALDLSEWAAEGKGDYYLASQMSMLVRKFAQVLDSSATFPDAPAIVDWLGMQIQATVGKATKPEGPPARKAVEPVHETEVR